MILLLLAALAAQPVAAQPPCDGASDCVTATPEQLFALADKLFADGDKAGAADILEALTQDRHIELRAEARFRLAAVRESMGDLAAAAAALRALLAEQPEANRARLELARILGAMGDAASARSELEQARVIGLPPEVEANVRRYATRFAPSRKRGLTLELTAGPDSNINRATASAFIDTIIAPFELDADARRRSGLGATGVARFHSNDEVGPLALLSRINARADLYDKSRFNDLQLSADVGPRFSLGKLALRPSAIVERRWFGGDLYATGIGADIALLAPLSSRAQAEFRASRVKQDIRPNRGQDGWRTSFEVALTHVLGQRTTAQLALRHGRVDARFKPESVRLWAASLVLAHQAEAVTVFGEAGIARTRGREPMFLFGERRRDTRIDLSGGAIFTKAKLGGFLPLVRLSHTDSRADIVLWDYRRTRLDVGVTRSF